MLEFFLVEFSIAISIEEVDHDLDLSSFNMVDAVGLQEINDFLSWDQAISTSVESIEKSLWVVVLEAWEFLSTSFKVTFTSSNCGKEIS